MAAPGLPDLDETPAPAPVAVPDIPDGDVARDEVQRRAEQTLWRRALVGVVVGMVVCAGLYPIFVVLAYVTTDLPLGPMLLTGAGVGLFAGAFFGGFFGTLAGARALEHAEQQQVHQQV